MLRAKIAFYLDNIETPIGIAISLTIGCLVLISSGIFVAETYTISAAIRHILEIIDTAILLLFTIEYLLRFWCAENKFKYFFSLYSIIDLVAILPVFLGATDIKFIRLLRWFRLLRLVRLLGDKTLIGRISSEDGAILTRILFTLFAIVFIFSGIIYQIEHPINPTEFKTFVDAFYFSIVTMTTVGYGDIAPTSQMGRLTTILMVLTGIALIPVQIGELIRRLVKTTNQVEFPCSNCGHSTHESDAKFCKVCGTELKKHQSS